ncbi:MAG: CPBP family intramembrane metalloprotease [Propionibacteriales bacterium]|nr:CPBP family intramembrane metalloprotease [Propionibacteriales bacterium]
MRDAVRRRPVLGFFALAYLLSWSWDVLLIARGDTVRAGVGWPTHLPALLGPAVAAVVVTAVVEGRAGLGDLARRMTRWRVGWGWWAIVAGTASLMLLGAIVPLLTGSDVPALGDFTRYSGIGSLTPIVVVVVALLVNGLGEETGWRGFAVDRLLREHSFTWTAVVVGAGWAGWHLPFFVMVDGFERMGPLAIGWLVGVMAGSVVLTWLYREGHRSILLVAAWHTAYNFTSATDATGAVVGTVTSILVISWAVWILRQEHLSARSSVRRRGEDAAPVHPRQEHQAHQHRDLQGHAPR